MPKIVFRETLWREVYLEPGQAFLLGNKDKTLIVYKERKDLSSPCNQCYYHKKRLSCYSYMGILNGITHVYCKEQCCFEESKEGL